MSITSDRMKRISYLAGFFPQTTSRSTINDPTLHAPQKNFSRFLYRPAGLRSSARSDGAYSRRGVPSGNTLRNKKRANRPKNNQLALYLLKNERSSPFVATKGRRLEKSALLRGFNEPLGSFPLAKWKRTLNFFV